MSKVVTIWQPQWLPRLHFLKRIVDSDLFVLMDWALLGKHCENTTPIKVGDRRHWMVVPLEKRKQGMKISEVRIAWETGWAKDVIKTVQMAYAKAPFFDELMPEIEQWFVRSLVVDSRSELLLDYDVAILRWLWELLKIRTPMMMQSELGECDAKKGDLMMELTKKAGCDVYHCGSEAPGMILDVEKFKANGVGVKVQMWDTPVYRQVGKGAFLPDLSVIDALLNVGVDETCKILMAKGAAITNHQPRSI